MKKILLFSLILLNTLIFKSLGAINNSLGKPYKIVERKSPEKHFTVNKDNLMEIFSSEPKNAIVEMEIPYLNTTEKFELERLDIRGEDNLGMTYTTSGHFFTTKLYNGLSYNINDFNNINMGTMTIYPNNVYINLRVNGEEIKIEKEFNTKITHISKNQINDKSTEDFKNIKDIISKIDKIKNEKILTKSDISAMKEVKDFDIKNEKESQQTFKQFKNDELLAPAPAPPPSNHDCEPLVYTRCQVILVNYMISYEMYLKWQTPTFIIENGKLTLKEGSIKKSYNQTAVTQVTQKLTNYFTQVVNIFKNEGINVQLGKIVVETEPLETYQKDFTPEQGALDNATSEVVYDIKHFKNQYLRGNREWKGWQSPYSEADDGAFKDIPKDDNDFYNGGNYSNINLWSCGRTNTSGVRWGLHGLFDVFNDYIKSVADNDTAFTLYNDRWTGKTFEKLTNANYFSTTPFIRIRQQIGPGLYGPTYGQSLSDFYDGFWFYIGDITPATTNENPAMSWKEFIRNENARANIIKYSGQNFANESNDWNGNNFTGWSMNMRWGNYNIPPGTFNHNNYLPMLVAPKDISDDNVLNLPNPSSYNSTLFGNIDPFVYYYDLSKKMPVSYQNIKVNGFDEVGAHLQSIGVSHPYISYPTKIYGLPNNTKFETIPDRTGIIPLLGNMWYYTYDLENVNTKYFDVLTNNGDWKNGDAINYKQYPMHKIIYDGDEIATDTVLQWNYQDVQELYGTTGQFGNSNHLAYNIDKWNVWMLVHHIAIKLGPRYFTTTTNRNTILAPLARNNNYDADNYTYSPNSGPEGTPHISERAPSEKNVPGNTSWLRHWYQTYLYPSFATGVSEPTDIMDLVWGNLGNALITAGIFVPLRIKFASKHTVRGNGENWWWNGYAHWFGNDDDKNLWHNGTTMTVTWVVLAVYIAATMVTQGSSFGWSREDLVPPVVGYQWPYIYRKHIQSTNSSGDNNYDEDDWDKKGDLKIGWQNWDARYSMWNLQLIDNMCPVDLVSFSKGFDKKTGDLIRLNLMGEEISGHGPNINNCNCTTDPNCVRGNGLIRGRPNPYATVSLWHKRNILSPAIEYQFAGDTIFARNNVLAADYPGIENNVVNEGLMVIKNNSLTTEEQINESDNFTNLDNWYGKQMKVQSRYEALDRPGGSRFDSTGYVWSFNSASLTNANGNFPITGLAGIPRARNKSRARIFIPNNSNQDSLMRIYPISLRLTDTSGCISNTAIKYIRVYPRKETPVRLSFIEKISPSSGASFTPYTPFGFSVGAFTLKGGTSRIKYDQFNLNTKNLYGNRAFGMKNWEFIGPWSTGEGNAFNEASTYTAGYYNRGMKPWSPSRFSNTGWSMGNLSTSLDPFYSGRVANNEHPVFHRNAYVSSRFAQGFSPDFFNYTPFQYATYVDNWSSYNTLFYFPIRSSEKAKEQYTVGDPALADPRFDKTYNYGLGAYDGGGVFFKNEHRPMYKAYAYREKPWKNWAFNIYEYYRPNVFTSGITYENNDDETFSVVNIGGGRLPSNAKSPIKYFYGRDRLFATNKIIDLGARSTYGYNETWQNDASNTWLGQGPEAWAHSSSWFHERDYIWINRTRANRVFPGIFSEGSEWYRLRPIIQTPPFNINWYDPITRIDKTYDFWTLSYLWGTNDVQFDNEQAIRDDYWGETRKRNYKATDYLNNEFGNLKSLPDWASLTNFRKGTSDTARSPLYFNDDNQNNYLRFKLSYSYFTVPDTGIVYYYAPTGAQSMRWSANIRAGQNFGADKIEIWARGVTENGTLRRSLVFEGNLKDMSSYKNKTHFKFHRFGDPAEQFEGTGSGNYTLTNNGELTPGYFNTQRLIRPGYVLNHYFNSPIEFDSVPMPIGTVAWFPGYTKNVYTGEIEPIKIYHKPMAEYLRSPINNRYYKNTVDWSDIKLDIRNFDDCRSLQFDIVYKNISSSLYASSLVLGSMEILSGRNIPLELCEGGDPTLEITNAVNDTIPLNPNVDPEDRVGNWKLTSPIPNNVYRYTINLIRPDNTRQLLKTGITEQTYSIDDNEIKKADGTFVGPILAEGSFQTTPGNQYNLEAVLENLNTANINGNIFNETEPQTITTSVTTYQKRLPKRKPIFFPDSAFNFDGNLSLKTTFFAKSNIQNFVLQKGTIVTTPTGESDTTWQNVGQTLTYTNCTPAMPTNVKFYNYNVTCSYNFNLTNIPDGLHLYRLRYSSILDNPTVEFTEPTSVAICRTCTVPLGVIKLYVRNSDSLTPNGQIPQLSDVSDFNYGNYNLYIEVNSPKPDELNNIDFVDVYEKNQSNTSNPFVFKKRVQITQQYNCFLQVDSIKDKKPNPGAYSYILRAYSAANNVSYPLQNSNFVQVKLNPRPCIPLNNFNIEPFTDILNFDLLSSCPLTKYRVLLYKLENSTSTSVDSNGNEVATTIYANNEYLEDFYVKKLTVNPTPIARFQNDEIPDGTIRFTQQERLNKMFSRLTPKPTTLNNWYRIDVICTACPSGSTSQNIKSIYYYFNE